MLFLLTCSWPSGHTLASSTVNCACILLQRLVGDAAGAIGSLASLDLGTRSVADTLDISNGGRGDGNKAKENGGDGELHLGEVGGFRV